jgi:hypothetical protein
MNEGLAFGSGQGQEIFLFAKGVQIGSETHSASN